MWHKVRPLVRQTEPLRARGDPPGTRRRVTHSTMPASTFIFLTQVVSAKKLFVIGTTFLGTLCFERQANVCFAPYTDAGKIGSSVLRDCSTHGETVRGEVGKPDITQVFVSCDCSTPVTWWGICSRSLSRSILPTSCLRSCMNSQLLTIMGSMISR